LGSKGIFELRSKVRNSGRANTLPGLKQFPERASICKLSSKSDDSLQPASHSRASFFDSGSIADPDIWWHLRNAEVFVQTHSVVHQDFYSFTAAGSRWINEAWLSECPTTSRGNGWAFAAFIS
jgi:hypothetical protein